ncbi:hypothetical protein ACOME3_001454 [Neoechinorhynchus agilis]
MTIFNVLLLISIKRTGWSKMASRQRSRLHTLSYVVLLLNAMFVVMSVPAGIVHAIGDRMFLRDKPYRKLLLMMLATFNTSVHAVSCIPYYVGSSVYRNALNCSSSSNNNKTNYKQTMVSPAKNENTLNTQTKRNSC